MVNSHYVPQFILRNFCEDGKILYCDLDNKKAEFRNTRSVFSEVGYYPDEMEKDLCKNVEYLFANLFHNKLEKSANSIILAADELFLIKKYLIITTIRYRYEDSKDDLTLRELLGEQFKEDFFGNINKILKCNTIDEMMKIVDINVCDVFSGENSENVNLWAEVKDVIHSYIVFIKPRGTEKFLIPDIGKGIYEGPISRRKMYGTLEQLMQQGKLELLQICQMMTPHDYTIYPLSKNFAVLSMSVFFKLLTESEIKCNMILPPDCPTVSSVLGFGSKNVINPPKVKFNRGKKEYHYEVQQLGPADISHFNSIMIAEAKQNVACSSLEVIKKSVNTAVKYTNRDLSFLDV